MNNPKVFPSLSIPERSIPVPRSISPEAQVILGRAAKRPFAWPNYPAPDDTAGWLQWADAANANMRAMVEAEGMAGPSVDSETLMVGDVSCYRFGDSTADGKRIEKVLLEIHGGGLIGGGGDLCSIMAAKACMEMGAVVYSPDYRMPPLYPYPTALDDCMAVYREVIRRHAPETVVVHGSSAGGNLAAALMLRAKAEGLALPAGLILESPELDLTESGDSFETNKIIDVVLQDGLGPVNRLYANGHDLVDPYLSPLFGDFSNGWPPTLLTAGTRDLFLSNAVRMLHRLREVAVPVELLVYEAMPHGGFFGTPEDRALRQDVLAFAERYWRGTPGIRSR